jgi:AAA+ ATPase superfamily predicted ATPase
MFLTNPYIVGNPVGNSPVFVGRADILREVWRVVRDPQQNAIVLYGQRRIGKTSVLEELEAQLPKEGAYYPIFFDLQNKAEWSLGRVLTELAHKISRFLKLAPPDLGDEPETTFRQVWLPDVLNKLPSNASLVLLFDEFDVLANPD